MKLLLDTHAFLWWAADDPRLSARATRAIGDPRNDSFLSVVSAWEIMVKAERSSLRLDDQPARFIPRELEANGFEVLPLLLRHTLALADLAEHHRDPFDRLLVAQAASEKMPIVTGDRAIRRYSIKVLW